MKTLSKTWNKRDNIREYIHFILTFYHEQIKINSTYQPYTHVSIAFHGIVPNSNFSKHTFAFFSQVTKQYLLTTSTILFKGAHNTHTPVKSQHQASIKLFENCSHFLVSEIIAFTAKVHSTIRIFTQNET